MKRNSARPRLLVTGDGGKVVAHAGSRMLCDLADEFGLTDGLSVAMAPTKQRRRGHDRGQVLVDLAVMLADGGETISDLALLRDQPSLFGDVASVPTAWRTLEAIDEDALARIATARAGACARAWAAGMDPEFYATAPVTQATDRGAIRSDRSHLLLGVASGNLSVRRCAGSVAPRWPAARSGSRPRPAARR